MESDRTAKIVGYSLVSIGVLIIIICLVNAYLIFTGTARPVSLFSFASVSLDVSKLLGMPQSQPINQELISKEVLNNPINLVAHLLILGFFASTGQKLATIGAHLVRPLKINVKQ